MTPALPKKFKRRLVLIDAHAIIHRAYHALPDFANSKGEPTGGLYGLSTMLIRILADLDPDYVAACYDRPEPTFRRQVYEEYKGKRPKTEPALVAQLEKSREVFQSFGIPIYELAGFEADDIIGTAVELLKEAKDLQIVVASGDMDTLQLVDGERVVVYTLRKGVNDVVWYDEEAVNKRFGFGPSLIPDYKGLAGDPSDNIVGVRGVGDKTASQLIVMFGPVESIYEKLESDEGLTKAEIKPRIITLLKEQKEEAEFSKVLATIRRDAPIDFSLPEKIWPEIFDAEVAKKLFAELEFRSLGPRLESLRKKEEREIETEVEVPNQPTDDASDSDWHELGVATWVLNSALTTPEPDDILAFTKTTNFLAAKEEIDRQLKSTGLEKVFQKIEQPLIPILTKARKRGILIDPATLAALAHDYGAERTEREKKIWELVGHEFNLNSPKQLAEVLYQELKLPLKGIRKTAGGVLSTKESELEKLTDVHPAIKEILAYRELQKLLSTYIDALPKLLDSNNRLHSTLNQHGTTTGRMSSANPNLQNIPVREGIGRAIRNAFVATPGYQLVALDYSQVEMRILAVLAKEPSLIKVFQEGKDVHAAVAAMVFSVPENEVTKDMRRRAKVINFGIVYGMGVQALKKQLGSTMKEAQDFYDNFFNTFPAIKNYFESIKSEARDRGYTETAFGRRRYFTELKSRIPYIRASAERMAVNAPIQGTAADMIKLAMIAATEKIKVAALEDKVFLLLQIHDELIYEIEESVAEKAAVIIKEAMEGVYQTTVPFIANTSFGRRWGDL